jgi:hypothetical protein
VIPGAKAVVFTASALIGDFEHATVDVQSLQTGQRKTLVRDAHFGRYAASGHLLFVRRNTLYAAPFDVQKLELAGASFPILENIANRLQSGIALFDVAENGPFIYEQGQPDQHRLVWLDRDGHLEPLRAPATRFEFGLRVSPDGTRLAVAMPAASFDVWTYDWGRDALNRVTFAPANDMNPVWSPDGAHLAYHCTRDTTSNICWSRADGAGEPVLLMTSQYSLTPYSFSPDGKMLTVGESRPDTKSDLWMLPVDDARSDRRRAGQPSVFLKTPYNEQAAMFSRDGRWVAYQSDESGPNEIYVRPSSGPARKWKVSTNGGTDPVWSRAKDELVYRSGQGLMVSSYETSDGAFAPAKPRLWVEKKDISQWFDLMPQGDKVVVVDDVREEGGSSRVTFMLNLFDELRRMAPVGIR